MFDKMLDKLQDLMASKPKQDWINRQAAIYTPDWWNISQQQYALYFAYGRDMPGHENHDMLFQGGAIQLGRAYTEEPFSLWVKKDPDYSFAVALKEEFKYTMTPYIPIHGDILLIPTEYLFFSLDPYFENGKTFTRRRVWLHTVWSNTLHARYGIVPSEGVTRNAAYIYVGKPDVWLDRINDYDYEHAPQHGDIYMKDFYYYGQYPRFHPD